MFQDGRRVTHTAIIVKNSSRGITQAATAAGQTNTDTTSASGQRILTHYFHDFIYSLIVSHE